MTQTIYIAGPMSGIPYFNFLAFDEAKAFLTLQGWNVISPADLDRELHGFEALTLPSSTDWTVLPKNLKLTRIMTYDALAVINDADAIYMLRGWEKSKGARAEKALAEWKGVPVIYEE